MTPWSDHCARRFHPHPAMLPPMDTTPSPDRASAIGKILANRDALAPFFSAGADQLARAYAPGKWTMRQLLIHITDSQTICLDRLRRIAADDKPLLLAFDQDRWVAHLHYERLDLGVSGALFHATMSAAADLARNLPPDADARKGVHSEAGLRTFAAQLDFTWQHVAHHLEQVRAAAAGKTWTAK